jgi:hypothetical protein
MSHDCIRLTNWDARKLAALCSIKSEYPAQAVVPAAAGCLAQPASPVSISQHVKAAQNAASGARRECENVMQLKKSDHNFGHGGN